MSPKTRDRNYVIEPPSKVQLHGSDKHEYDKYCYDTNQIEIELRKIRSVGDQLNQSVPVSSLDNDSTLNINDYESLEEQSCPDGGLSANVVAFGAILGVTANLGLINSIGAIQIYVSTHQLKDVLGSSISWIFFIFVGLTYVVSFFTGVIFDSHGPTGLLIGSLLLTFGGLMGAADSTSVYHFVLSFTALGVAPAWACLH